MTASRTFTWFISVAALAALGLLMSFTGAARPFQSGAQRAAEPVEAALHGVTAPLADAFANIGSYGRIRDENRDLRTENERLRVELAEAREEAARGTELSALLGVGNQRAGDQVTYASIIARDPSPLRDVVQINRGTRDGVQKDMVVLGSGGALVGTVETAHESVSWVRLITDARSGVNAVVQESRAIALAAGSSNKKLRMEFLAQGAEVKAGDTVLTSGLGGSYPAGLLIGRVARVEGGPLDVFKRVTVEPAARLTSVEVVAVLTSFRPAPLESVTR